MKKLILIVVLFISGNVFSQLGDYFISNNHSKAKGLNFKIKKPLDYKQSEAFSSNTVQKWEKMFDNFNDDVLISVLVYEVAGFSAYTNEELKQLFKDKENQKNMVSQLPNLERYEYFEIDNYPGLITDSRNDIASSYVTSISIFVDSYNFQIQMGGSKKTRDDYKNLLYKMAASVVFTDY